MKVTGWPTGTVIRGNIVMRDGEAQRVQTGQPMRFHDTGGG